MSTASGRGRSNDRLDLASSVRAWLEGWGAEVAAVDFDAGARRFDPDVVAFGTRADVVTGLDEVARQQWRHVWPTIADFSFDVDNLVVLGDGLDGGMVVAVVPWTSIGFDEDGQGFERPGRATIVLRRHCSESSDLDWQAIHTHFSLGFGTPPRSFGRPDSPTEGKS